MKFNLKYAGENLTTLMRRVGYFFLEEGTNEMSFVRPLQRSGYPRFHLYIKVIEQDQGRELALNLHLDQKKPVYKGVTAHSGEYEGPLVEGEAERIRKGLGFSV